MAWANPNNINTANLDANTDSPALARADIKTAFDELRNVANNSKVSWTPAYNLTAGTVTFTYNTQEGNYIEMGDIVYFELHLDANVLVSDLAASEANIEITGFPFNPSSTIAPVKILLQERANFSAVTPEVIRLQTTGNKGLLYSTAGGDFIGEETLLTGLNMSSGVTVNNVTIKAKGWYFK
jgi:hypothetical protein